MLEINESSIYDDPDGGATKMAIRIYRCRSVLYALLFNDYVQVQCGYLEPLNVTSGSE